MTSHYVNLHTGNLWKRSADMGTEQEFTRVEDGVIFVGQRPQYFRKIKSAAD